MKPRELIHASTRPAWTARLLLYIAAVVSLSIFVQVVIALWLPL